MFRKILITFCLSSILLLSGCATIFSGSTQNIRVQALDSRDNQLIPGAVCTITDGKGRTYPISTNPGSALVSKGQGALSVHCLKKGFRQTQIGVGQNISGWTVANVLFWPGFIVDAASGAIQKYPDAITVMMEPVSKR